MQQLCAVMELPTTAPSRVATRLRPSPGFQRDARQARHPSPGAGGGRHSAAAGLSAASGRGRCQAAPARCRLSRSLLTPGARFLRQRRAALSCGLSEGAW